MNTDVKNPHLGAIIREERKRLNLTQEHLAQLAEVDVRTIQRAERDSSCSSESLMAIAEAFKRDCTELIAEAKERENKQRAQPKPLKDLAVRLDEISNGHELFGKLKSAHGWIEDFDTSLESQHLAEIGSIFDLLRDYGDIQSDLMPSDIIRISEDIGSRIAALSSSGLVCLVGDYVERLIYRQRPDEPLN